MAYANKYSLTFKNRQNETYTAYILEKDFIGTAEILEGGPDPFILDYRSGDDDAAGPIRGSTAKLSFYNNGAHPLLNFVSNNDDQFKIEIYNTVGLRWTGFIIQDDSTEQFVRASHYLVSLQATDNLGLLKEVSLKVGDFTADYARQPLKDYLALALLNTGLDLPINIYCNIYENGMDDRTVGDLDPLAQAYVDTRSFIKNDLAFEDWYTIVNKILTAWKCTLLQANGEWQVIRWAEAKDFFNAIPGTRYETGSYAGVVLSDLKPIGLNEQIIPISANHEKSLIRPVKSATLTYDYVMPPRLIINNDFTILGNFISTSTAGTTKTDLYEMPWWNYVNPPATDAYIVVKTNTITGVEVDRYGVMPFKQTFDTYLESNEFDVNAGDRFECSLRFRADSNTSDNIIFRFGIYLVGISGAHWSLTRVSGVLQWNNIGSATLANGISLTVLSSADKTEWVSIDVFEGSSDTYVPAIPEDGVMQLHIQGFNDSNVSQPTKDTYIKDVAFTYIYYINNSTKITGQQNSSTQTATIKKSYSKTIFIDDSPKNSVKGAMFLDDLTTKTSMWHRGATTSTITADFEARLVGNDLSFLDQRRELMGHFHIGNQFIVSGTASNNTTFTILNIILNSTNGFAVSVSPAVAAETVIGGTITFLGESKRFGYLQASDILFKNDQIRLKIEGDYFGLKDTGGDISMTTIFTMAGLPGKYFILGPVSFNFFRARFTGVLEELWDDQQLSDDDDYTNTFKYLYGTT